MPPTQGSKDPNNGGPFKGVIGGYIGFRVKGPRTQIIGI